MFRFALPVTLSVIGLFGLLVAASAQDEQPPPKKEPPKKAAPATEEDYREFFKKPETPLDFWKAMQFEIEVGRYDLAARNLRGLLDLKPSDQDLLDILNKYGMSAFLGLQNLRKWGDDPKDTEQAKKDVQVLIDRVSTAQKKLLTDPDRITGFIKNLNATPEERDYAVQELHRSGAAAVPYLIDALQVGSTDDRANILYALRHMGADAVPPILAALDINDPVLQVQLIDTVLNRVEERSVYDPVQKRVAVERRSDLLDLHHRAETDPAPWWWGLTASANAAVRQKALEALSLLLDVPPTKLPQARQALTQEAERYYRHKVKFLDPGAVTVWRWDGKRVLAGWPGAPTVPTSRAEEYYGLRFARQALAIDPTYEPAQVVFLSLALEKGVERAGLDQPLAKGAPNVENLLATINPDLVVAVLDRALTEQNLPVILGAVRALGELADARAVRPTSAGGDAALVRALYYADRRIQMAAADTLLRLPHPPAGPAPRQVKPTAPPAPARVVEILRRAVALQPAAKGRPKVIIAHAREEVTTAAGKALEKAGFEPVPEHTGRDVLRRLNEASDVDLILIDADLPDPGLVSLLGQLRADVNAGLLPVVVLVAPEREEHLRRVTEPYRNVSLAPPHLAVEADSDAQKRILLGLIRDAMGELLSDAQLKDYAERSLHWLAEMARGNVAGYDVRPAADTVLEALRSGNFSKDAQLDAVEIVAHLPGTKPQTDLAAVLLDTRRDLAVRNAAALALERHIEQHGLALSPGEVQTLQALYASSETDPALRANVALVMGSLRPDARQTGERLQQFQPLPPAPTPAPVKEKEPK